jgi:hypothetical protein
MVLSRNHTFNPCVAIGILPAQRLAYCMLLIYTSCLREMFDERLTPKASSGRKNTEADFSQSSVYPLSKP